MKTLLPQKKKLKVKQKVKHHANFRSSTVVTSSKQLENTLYTLILYNEST